MTKTLFFLTAFLAAQEANAFAPSAGSIDRALGGLHMVDDAQVLSDYMAKSHEEKLRAIKEVEDKKNSEIAELKAQIEQLKSNPALPAAAPVQPVSIISASDAEAKLASYQKFMSEYIVNAQNQKLLAVKEAELKAEKKFQDRLEQLLAASGAALPSSDAVETQPAAAAELSLFQKRNLKVAAAGEAGKSRWGSLEVKKATENAKSQPPVVVASSTVAESSLFEQRNARVVAAADAGKSRWGDMEVQKAKSSGITSLEDRVSFGASLFDRRNARVVAAAAAGKSRWGDMEVQKAGGSSPAPATPAPAKVVTLEDRVNLGARLVGV